MEDYYYRQRAAIEYIAIRIIISAGELHYTTLLTDL